MPRMLYVVRCYRCGEEEREEVESAQVAEERVTAFKLDHRGSCGMSASFSSQVGAASLTGDGIPR